MIKRDFQPGFYVDHFIKDLGIAIEEARAMRLSLPGLALASRLYEAVREQGHGRLGSQALMLAYERCNGIT
jgi:3-hydroxyisobutyrate dehydrogenase